MLQYLVVLAGTDPLVWRRIRVPATYSFWDLHVAIQDAMGWLDYHLHRFQLTDPRSGTTLRIGIPDPDVPADRSMTAGWKEFPIDYSSGGSSVIDYLYDFGDDWRHALIFEGFERSDRPPVGPKCVAGAGACPPEDAGGPHRYATVLAALRDPDHPEHQDLIDWAGGAIDPSDFSVADVSFDDPQERWERAFGETGHS
jgi:hypothetical protein